MAEQGSAVVDGVEILPTASQASVDGDLIVVAQNNVLVDVSNVTGSVDIDETDGNDVGDTTDRILANIGTAGGFVSVRANGGSADLIGEDLQAGFEVVSDDVEARAKVAQFSGGNGLVEWADSTVLAIDGGVGGTVTDFVAGPADATGIPAEANAGDVAVSGTFDGYDLDIDTDVGVVLGGGVTIVGLDHAVEFDTNVDPNLRAYA